MGISLARYRAHVAEYEAKHPNYRKSWPRYLFRHEPVKNAIEILKRGTLLSRTHAVHQGIIQNDIAPRGILENRQEARDRTRLYFRPRNPTQYHIEGIRKPIDYYEGKHAGFLVLFLFNSERVLTSGTTRFSCGNMQSGNSEMREGDIGFNALDFDKIYHDSAHNSSEITRQKCAEVLPKSPFLLAETLEHIVVRTDADVLTLKHLLEQERLTAYVPKVKKSVSTGLFFDRYTALDYIDMSPSRIHFKLKHSYSHGPITTKIEVSDWVFGGNILVSESELIGGKAYFIEFKFGSGQYLVKVYLEGSFAHESVVFVST